MFSWVDYENWFIAALDNCVGKVYVDVMHMRSLPKSHELIQMENMRCICDMPKW